jgi:ribosomal protein L2
MRTYKPRTPGVRHLKRPINDHLYKGRPLHKLTFPKKGHARGGRNNSGQVSVRHRGGGHKRRIRTVDFARLDPGRHTVERVEHDPNRTAHIALLRSKVNGKVSYIVAAEGMRAGDNVESYIAGIPQELMDAMGGSVDPGVLAARTAWRGNCLPLHMIPIGTQIYNIGMKKGQGGIFCRSAGTYATVISKGEEALERRRRDEMDNEQARLIKESTMTGAELVVAQGLREEEQRKAEKAAKFVSVRLQSGEVRLIDREACATVGVASNANFKYGQLGKAGRKRWLGIRPTVRGVAMNACDHPHGGGRGKSKGNRHPMSIWGKPVSNPLPYI